MKKTGRCPRINLLVLTIALFGISLVLIGCGMFEDDNSQPSIGTMTDDTITDRTLTLAVNSWRTVEIYISDVDDDDMHTISASSENTAVATVSVDERRHDKALIITGIAEGSTTVTVTATDDSGEDNAIAKPMFINVTVVEPQLVASTPSPLTDISLYRGVVSLTLVGLIYEEYYNTQ